LFPSSAATSYKPLVERPVDRLKKRSRPSRKAVTSLIAPISPIDSDGDQWAFTGVVLMCGLWFVGVFATEPPG
jgi:hypothetical protein